MERAAATIGRDPLRAHSIYYVVTGIWPIVHLRSFMFLTGRKTDTWLVQTFGALITALGVAILPRARVGRRAQENVAIGAALSLAASDGIFVLRRRIRPVYLLDAAVELALASAIAAKRGRRAAEG